MIQKCKPFFKNSPLMVLLSLVMAVSFLSFPVHVKAAEKNTIVFYDTDVTVQNTIGSSSSGYNYASLGLYPTASSGYSGQIQVSSSSSTIYVVTNKDTGESCYARGFTASSNVCIPLVVYTNDDILTSSDKSDIINQINTTIKTYYDYLYTLINGKFTNLQTSLDASFAGISSDITIAKSAIVSTINSQTTILQGNLNTQTSALNNSIDAQTQVLLDAINNSQINPLFLKSFPSSTGMSYSTIDNYSYNSTSTLDISCYKVDAHYFQFQVHAKFPSTTIYSGSYMLKFLFGNVTPNSGVPNILSNISKYKILNAKSYYNYNSITALNIKEDYSMEIYFDFFNDDYSVNDLFFTFYIYYSGNLDDYSTSYTGGYRLFRSDSNLILDNLQDIVSKSDSNTQKQIDAVNANTQKEIDAANANTQKEIDNANKNADDIMHSYDSTGQDDKNKEFADSQKELQEAEDSLFSSAQDAYNKVNFSDYDLGVINGLSASLSFVSSFLQSVYVKMGDFGIIMTTGIVIMIASKAAGLYRFSSGGG